MSNIVDKIDELYENHTHAEVEKFMLDTRDELMKDEDANAPDIIAVCNELGALYREESRFSESSYNFETALRLTEKVRGTKMCEEYGVILFNDAGTYRYAGQFEKAQELYDAAYEILTALGKDDTYEFAGLLNNMSNNYQDLKQFDKAVQFSAAAYEIICKLSPGQTEEAIALMNMATLLVRVGELDKASTNVRKAIDIYESHNNRSGHYPNAVNLAAVIDFKRGDYQAALENFERAAELIYDHFGANRDYAAAMANISAVYDKLGDHDKAAEYLKKSEEIKANLK
ncbi:MAG: tetratricopeptide repeat protein [Coriobacteriales bacterium]|jgi:tetratricopeptide (TPR) repeat protein